MRRVWWCRHRVSTAASAAGSASRVSKRSSLVTLPSIATTISSLLNALTAARSFHRQRRSRNICCIISGCTSTRVASATCPFSWRSSLHLTCPRITAYRMPTVSVRHMLPPWRTLALVTYLCPVHQGWVTRSLSQLAHRYLGSSQVTQ